MKHSPSWEAKTFLASQDISRILRNLKVHYRNYKCQTTVPILSQINPVHVSPSQSLKTNFNIIIPSAPRSSKWFLSITCPDQNPVCTPPSSSTCHVLRPSHRSWFDHANDICWWVQTIKLLVISLLHSLVSWSTSDSDIFLSTLFSDILSHFLLCSKGQSEALWNVL
jgi:hypothetical protein